MSRSVLLASLIALVVWTAIASGCRRHTPAGESLATEASPSVAGGSEVSRSEEAPMRALEARPEDALAQPISGEVYNPAPPRSDLPAAPPQGSDLPLPEGALPNGLTEEGSWVVASYVTESPFSEVKGWYMAELPESKGWRNDGIEASPFGTDEWEFVRAETGERVRIEALPGMPTTVELRVRR